MNASKDQSKAFQVSAIIAEMLGRKNVPYSLVGTPFAFLGPSRRFRKKGDAVEALKRAKDIVKSATALQKFIAKLDDLQEELIFNRAYAELQIAIEEQVLDQAPSLNTILTALKEAASADAVSIQWEIENHWQSKVRTSYPHEAELAEALVEIYVQELCEFPSVGTREGPPSNDFMRALQKTFEIFDIQILAHSPADAAIEKAKANTDLKQVLERREEIRSTQSALFAKRQLFDQKN